MLSFYNETMEEVLRKLETDEKSGLTSEKASAAYEKYGANRLSEKKPKKDGIITFM